jgi:uncharacterized protein YndB with AHSA1/START domain
MPHPFKVDVQVDVNATPADVWEAITTGPGIDGWFISAPNAVEPRLGGVVRTAYGDDGGESTITAWDPPHRFAHAGEPGPDGVMHAMEYTIEGRVGGTTIVRLVHSGFLGDDWEGEYEALTEGDPMYLHQMAQYVEHFRGRRATVIATMQPNSLDRARSMALYRAALGLSEAVEGAPVRFAPDGLPAVEGVVDFVSPSIIGVRSADALYRFSYVAMGVVYLGHHIYRYDIDKSAITAAWTAWLERAFAA